MGEGGVRTYALFASDGQDIQASTSTRFEIVGTSLDGPLENIRAGVVGYDVETSVERNQLSASWWTYPRQALAFGAEAFFGQLGEHHARLQVVVFGPLADQDRLRVSRRVVGTDASADAVAKVYGTITGDAGPITAVIATGNVDSRDSMASVPIDRTGLGWVTARLRIEATTPNVGDGKVAAVLLGVDLGGGVGQTTSSQIFVEGLSQAVETFIAPSDCEVIIEECRAGKVFSWDE